MKMDGKPAVSVIIPTYNRANLLGRSINSILEQTFTDFELIVVDDGSSDNTRELVESFNDPRIFYVRHEKNRGVSAARNTGIKIARGEYIAFNDSDDEWLPQKLDKQVTFFKDNKNSENLGLVLCEYILIGAESKQYRVPQLERINTRDMLSSFNCQCGTPGLLLKRSVAGPELFFDEGLPAYEDLDIMARLSRICEIGCVPQPLFRY
jgi:glycosyltransferase involved in cell wall biosynthesis